MPRFKREASEISLLDIPPIRPAVRGSSVQLKHLQQRQIDLNAITVATENKLKRKANIEEELRGAINTLKKPNRGLAVKDYVESTEQRSLGSKSMRKKTAGPIRKVLQNAENVQVTATPRHNRKTNALIPMTAQKAQAEHHNEPLPPSSGDFCIPSSTVRPSTGGRSEMRQPFFHSKRLDTGKSVTETPSRGSSKMVSFGDLKNHHKTSTGLTSNSAAHPYFARDYNCTNTIPGKHQDPTLSFYPPTTYLRRHFPSNAFQAPSTRTAKRGNIHHTPETRLS